MIGIPVTIALTGSRGALIGLVVVGIAVLITLRRVSVVKRVTILAAVAAGLFFAAPDGYWKQMSTLLSLTEDYNYSTEYGRKGIAKRGYRLHDGPPVLWRRRREFSASGRNDLPHRQRAPQRGPVGGVDRAS